jgi:zinc D-Ala-D-Ala dipeptidase
MKRSSFIQVLWCISILLFLGCDNNIPKNPYGLSIITTKAEFMESVRHDGDNAMVDIELVVPGVLLDIRYASKNNFTGQQVYELPKAFLRKPAAMALKNVQAELAEHGLGLKVFDAYRPYGATLKFYEIIGDTNFVAAPWHGSRHNRGCAVDVTLINLTTGQELEMPTGFDDFTAAAAPDFNDLPDHIITNRQLLIDVMKRHHFTVYPYEWWHFDFKNWENFSLMDIPLNEFEAITRESLSGMK